MKKILFLIYLIPFLIIGQSENSFQKLVDNEKTNLTSEKINELIVGKWIFTKLTDNKGNQIKVIIHNIDDTIQAKEIVIRPNIIVRNDKTYELFDCSTENNCSKGTWNFDNNERVLKFLYDKPKDNIPIEMLPPEIREQLKKNITLEDKGFDWEIVKINNTELQIIEYLESDGTEFNYNLRHYEKN